MKKPTEILPGVIPLYGNYHMEIGYGTFTDNESDTTIATQLEEVKAGMVTYTTSSATASDSYVDLAIESDISSAAIAVHRQNASTGLADLTDAAFSYLLIGTLDLTD